MENREMSASEFLITLQDMCKGHLITKESCKGCQIKKILAWHKKCLLVHMTLLTDKEITDLVRMVKKYHRERSKDNE